jgi:hypothetical protein
LFGLLLHFAKYAFFLTFVLGANFQLQRLPFWPGRFWFRLVMSSLVVGSAALSAGVPVGSVLFAGVVIYFGGWLGERVRKSRARKSRVAYESRPK